MATLLTHEKFLETYIRVPEDFDGGQGIQCVDLAKLYSEKVLGIKLGYFGWSARSGWLNKSKTFDLKLWDKIPNSPTWVPSQGDIIFYDEPWLTGHVAIVHEATVDDVLLIEQNGATGNWKWKGYDAINFENKRDYRKCLGWYHKKVTKNPLGK